MYSFGNGCIYELRISYIGIKIQYMLESNNHVKRES